MHVLIVEDSRATALKLQAALASLGHACTVVENGQQALERLAVDPDIELVLADWMMPELDGLGLIRALKQGRAREVPVALMSVIDPMVASAHALQAGAVAYLGKPLRSADLAQLLRQMGDGGDVAAEVLGLTIVLAGSLPGAQLAPLLRSLGGADRPPILVVHQGPWAAAQQEQALAGERMGRDVIPVEQATVLECGRVYGTSRDCAPNMDPGRGILRVGKAQSRSMFTRVLDPLFKNASAFHGKGLRVVALGGEGSDGVTGISLATRGGARVWAADPRRHAQSSLVRCLLESVQGVTLGTHEELAKELAA